MNITIENKEMSIATISDLIAAQAELMQKFAESLIGTRESIKQEVKEEVEQEFMNGIDLGGLTTDEFKGWLDEMSAAGYIGMGDDEIAEKVMRDALSHTDYSSVEEMQEAIEEMGRAFEAVHDAIYDYI